MWETLLWLGVFWGICVIGVLVNILWAIWYAPTYDEYGEEYDH